VTTRHDVPGENLVSTLANSLKSVEAIDPPGWSNFTKTAVHKEKAPIQDDWWYFRSASVLRKVANEGPIGTERLSKSYSGTKDRGSKPNRSMRGSRKVIRLIMQQLEIAGFIQKVPKSGRSITPKGQSFLDNTAFDVKKKLQREMSSLKKY